MELLEELDLGSARGGKAGQNRAPLHVQVSRGLTEDDLPAIQAPPPVSAGLPVVKTLRSSHHRLAQLMAEGKPGTEISLVTGYSQSYISNIKHDPAFAELVAYYQSQRTTIFIDAQERLRLLGLDATEKLHDKLRDDAEPWSKRELMELIDMTLVAPLTAKPGQNPAGASGNNLNLEIKFVGVQPSEGPVVEASFTEIKLDDQSPTD